jgi:von Willebrand factor type A C-terminal domain/von Willebrand factor type A domain
MNNSFKAEVFQNQYVPQGADEIHAIMTVTAAEGVGASTSMLQGGRLFGIICDVSGSMEGGKIVAAKNAMVQLIDLLPPDCAFFVVTGQAVATTLCPMMLATPAAKARAIAAVKQIKAGGSTCISTWLKAALEQFRLAPNAMRQALLLTDGQNEGNDEDPLKAALKLCEGAFQCDCRGVGTDWKVDELRRIAGVLLGTTDIIAQPNLMEADFKRILAKALGKSVGDVSLRLWTPAGAQILFCKQVSPEIVDLTGRMRQAGPQVREYPTGAWGKNETRDYHFCIKVKPGAVGDEVLAGRASLVYTLDRVENKGAEARILAIWTDDEAKSAKIDRVVAHYTGQADLADSIQQGLEARARGDFDQATALLGKAVRVAHASGNEATEKLLRGVVDVQNAETGTVRLRADVAKEDEMALNTRSTKTTRVTRG